MHPAPECAEQPIRKVTTVPALTAAVAVVQVIVGADPADVPEIAREQVVEPAEKLTWILPVESALNIKVDADGDA